MSQTRLPSSGGGTKCGIGGGGGGVLTLSGEAAAGNSFQYTADSSAAGDSPSGGAACGFIYSLPSPSPPCPLRAGTPCNVTGGTVRSAFAGTKGRKLDYEDRIGTNSHRSPSRVNATAATTSAASSVRRSPAVPLTTDAGRASSRDVSCLGGKAGVTPPRRATASAVAQDRNNNAARTAAGLFATLLDNINPSQMMPSQPTQEEEENGASSREGENRSNVEEDRENRADVAASSIVMRGEGTLEQLQTILSGARLLHQRPLEDRPDHSDAEADVARSDGQKVGCSGGRRSEPGNPTRTIASGEGESVAVTASTTTIPAGNDCSAMGTIRSRGGLWSSSAVEEAADLALDSGDAVHTPPSRPGSGAVTASCPMNVPGSLRGNSDSRIAPTDGLAEAMRPSDTAKASSVRPVEGFAAYAKQASRNDENVVAAEATRKSALDSASSLQQDRDSATLHPPPAQTGGTRDMAPRGGSAMPVPPTPCSKAVAQGAHAMNRGSALPVSTRLLEDKCADSPSSATSSINLDLSLTPQSPRAGAPAGWSCRHASATPSRAHEPSAIGEGTGSPSTSSFRLASPSSERSRAASHIREAVLTPRKSALPPRPRSSGSTTSAGRHSTDSSNSNSSSVSPLSLRLLSSVDSSAAEASVERSPADVAALAADVEQSPSRCTPGGERRDAREEHHPASCHVQSGARKSSQAMDFLTTGAPVNLQGSLTLVRGSKDERVEDLGSPSKSFSGQIGAHRDGHADEHATHAGEMKGADGVDAVRKVHDGVAGRNASQGVSGILEEETRPALEAPPGSGESAAEGGRHAGPPRDDPGSSRARDAPSNASAIHGPRVASADDAPRVKKEKEGFVEAPKSLTPTVAAARPRARPTSRLTAQLDAEATAVTATAASGVAVAPRPEAPGGLRRVGVACEDDSPEKAVFTDGAAGRGRTNWAASVCGREEHPIYPAAGCDSRGVPDLSIAAAKQRPPPVGEPVGAGISTMRTCDEKTSSGTMGEANVMGQSTKQAPRASGSPRKVPYAQQRQQEHQQQQIAFTSDEESCTSATEAAGRALGSKPLLALGCEESPARVAPLLSPPPTASWLPAEALSAGALLSGNDGPASRNRSCSPSALPLPPARAGGGTGKVPSARPTSHCLPAQQEADNLSARSELAGRRSVVNDGAVTPGAMENVRPVAARAAVAPPAARVPAAGWFPGRRHAAPAKAAAAQGSEPSEGTPTPSQDLLAVRQADRSRRVANRPRGVKEATRMDAAGVNAGTGPVIRCASAPPCAAGVAVSADAESGVSGGTGVDGSIEAASGTRSSGKEGGRLLRAGGRGNSSERDLPKRDRDTLLFEARQARQPEEDIEETPPDLPPRKRLKSRKLVAGAADYSASDCSAPLAPTAEAVSTEDEGTFDAQQDCTYPGTSTARKTHADARSPEQGKRTVANGACEPIHALVPAERIPAAWQGETFPPLLPAPAAGARPMSTAPRTEPDGPSKRDDISVPGPVNQRHLHGVSSSSVGDTSCVAAPAVAVPSPGGAAGNPRGRSPTLVERNHAEPQERADGVEVAPEHEFRSYPTCKEALAYGGDFAAASPASAPGSAAQSPPPMTPPPASSKSSVEEASSSDRSKRTMTRAATEGVQRSRGGRERAADLAALHRRTASLKKKTLGVIAELKRARESGRRTEVRRLLKAVAELRTETSRCKWKPRVDNEGGASAREAGGSNDTERVAGGGGGSKSMIQTAGSDTDRRAECHELSLPRRSASLPHADTTDRSLDCSATASPGEADRIPRQNGDRAYDSAAVPPPAPEPMLVCTDRPVVGLGNSTNRTTPPEEAATRDRGKVDPSVGAMAELTAAGDTAPAPPAPSTPKCLVTSQMKPKSRRDDVRSSLPSGAMSPSSSALDVPPSPSRPSRETRLAHVAQPDLAVGQRRDEGVAEGKRTSHEGAAPCPPPTADQLNDPVFRAMAKARSRAVGVSSGTDAGGETKKITRSWARCTTAAAAAGDGGNFVGARGDGAEDGAGLTGRGRRQLCNNRSGGESGGGDRSKFGAGGWMSARDWSLDCPRAPITRESCARQHQRQQQQQQHIQAMAELAVETPLRKTKPAEAVRLLPPASDKPPVALAPQNAAGSGPLPMSSVQAGELHAETAEAAAAEREGRDTKISEIGVGNHGSGSDPSAGQHKRVGVGLRSHARKKRRRHDGRDAAGLGSPTRYADRTVQAAAVQAPEVAATETHGSGRNQATSTTKPASSLGRTAAGIRSPVDSCGRSSDSDRRGHRDRPPSSKAQRRHEGVVGGGVSIARSPGGASETARNRGGARGEEMLRQARAQVSRAGYSAGTSSEDRAGIGITKDRRGRKSTTFCGLACVLFELPDGVTKALEGTITDGGGRVATELPSSAWEDPWLAADDIRKALAPSAAARRESRQGTVDPVHPDVVVGISSPTASRSPEYILAVAAGVTLVHHLWVSDSAAEGRALPVGPYLLPGARETSRRRQTGAYRRWSSGWSSATGAPAAAAAAAEATRKLIAKAVTKPGTPLTGMTIGLAHPSSRARARWSAVLHTAGAEEVCPVTAELCLDGGDAWTSRVPPLKGSVDGRLPGRVVDRGTHRGNVRDHRFGAGDNGARVDTLRATLAGLDCLVCQYPSAWCDDAADAGVDSPLSRGRNAARPHGSYPLTAGVATEQAGRRAADRAPAVTTASRLFACVMLAARDVGVPVVSLSWVADCVVRGVRIKREARPEYTRPFEDEGLWHGGAGGNGSPRSGGDRTWAAGRVISSSGSSSSVVPERLHVIASPGTSVRYETYDYVRFACPSDRGSTVPGPRRRMSASGGDNDDSSDAFRLIIGRIAHIERSRSGRIMVALESFQEGGTLATTASSGAVFHVGAGRAFANPSLESSVSRGRARRAQELKRATGGGRTGRSVAQYVEPACLRGRVIVLKAQEFESRSGYCGRDRDVYVERASSRSKNLAGLL